ncbi:uncharacterized protein [Chelonus insularis]|uniref:uncharacterized protein n=1 Tax=Chelonus insularis TaxID=460826 RepID=UPI00158C1D27|nr:uncharacterized protein LOC118065337 [Chelonus insularis]
MYGFYLVLFLTIALFEKASCGVSISFCNPTTTGLFPFPGNCTKYISCNQGVTTIFSCTHGSTFNQELNRCDYEQRPDNCQNSIGSLKDLRIFCPKGSSNSFPHPFDCKKYIACSHGLTYNMNCSDGTVYSSMKSICDWRYNVPGCYGNLGDGVTLRGDVILSSINLDTGSMSFETIKYVGNEHQTNQNHPLHETNKPSLGNNQPSLQPVNYNNHSTNKPIHYNPEQQPNYSIQNGYANGNQQYNHQTNYGNQQIISNENYSANGPTYHQPGKPSSNLVHSPTINQNPPLNYPTTPNTHLQPVQNENYGVNIPPYHQSPLNHGYYSTPNKYPNQNQATGYQTDSKHNQDSSIYKLNTPTKTTPAQSNSQPIIFPTEKPTTEEDKDLDIDIRMIDDKLNDRSISKIRRNGRADTVLSFDQVLAINNLTESKKVFNKLNEDKDHIELSSELHARIVNSPNNWFNGKPLEPIDNHIDGSRATEQVNDGKLVRFKEEIESVSFITTKAPSTKIIVENSPSINVLNYNYIEDNGNGSVQIDQDYSKIRNHTVRSRMNNNNVRKSREIQQLNHESTGLRTLFSDNSTDDTFLSTLFVTQFKSNNNSQHIKVINQLSGQVLRLRGGSSAHHGYVEIRGIGFVGQCDNTWNLKRAHKICKYLGYKRGAKIIWKGQSNDTELPLSSLESDVFCQDEQSEFHVCKLKTNSECSIERNTIGVECMLDSSAYCSTDDVPFHKNCYHLVNSSLDLSHDDAIQYCSSRNSSLLYITAQDENDFISEWLTQKYPQVESIMTAGIGFTTMARTIWVWQDSAKSFFNFMKWWPGWKNEKTLPPSAKSSASCIVMKNKFPCYDQPNLNCRTNGYFFWDVEDCTSSMKGNYYICKRPYNNISL